MKRTSQKQWTIQEIASRAHAAVSTVSRVLNDHPDVSSKTRERIKKVLARYNYRPHAGARQLVQKSSRTICFCLANRSFLLPFHARILDGVAQFCREQDHDVAFVNYFYEQNTPPNRLVLPDMIWERGAIDGVIIAGMNYPNFVRAVGALGIPFVVFGNNVLAREKRFARNAVYFDEGQGPMLATRHLLDLGHRNIWFVGDTSLPWFKQRYQAYATAMTECGLEPRAEGMPLKFSGVDTAGITYGKEAIAKVYADDPTVTAIVAGDDEIACGVIHWARSQKILVPQELSVVGFDDLDANRFLDVGLTTVKVPQTEVGMELARLLLMQLHSPGRPQPSSVLSTEFIVRETTAPPHHTPASAAAERQNSIMIPSK
jgi:LacI family transcriptional regulator